MRLRLVAPQHRPADGLDLTGDALGLRVLRVADDDDGKPALRKVARRAVDFRDEGTRRVHDLELACGRDFVNARRDAVRREDDRLPFGHVLDVVDKRKAEVPQFRDHDLVVDEFVQAVDATELEGLRDRAVDAGAEPVGLDDLDLHPQPPCRSAGSTWTTASVTQRSELRSAS